MKRRTFEEMISYFNQTVSDMDISRKYKMTLLGIVTALLQKHDEDVQHWIPVTEALPEMDKRVLCTEMSGEWKNVVPGRLVRSGWLMEKHGNHNNCIAWMPMPEPYKGEQDE